MKSKALSGVCTVFIHRELNENRRMYNTNNIKNRQEQKITKENRTIDAFSLAY